MTTLTEGQVCSDRERELVVPPPWVSRLIGRVPAPMESGLRVLEGDGFSLVSGIVPGADRLGALDLQRAVCALYVQIGKALSALRTSRPVRLWNYIPGIHAPMARGDGGFLDRYMVFNAGRFAAYAQWYGGDVGPRAATATGIGHRGPDLIVHCLAAADAGAAIENPRQVPAYRYSSRRGPLPPVFARATLVNTAHGRLLLVGGTSSVRGEHSVHVGDIREQTLETFHNLASLLTGEASASRPEAAALRAGLSAYRTLRVYCTRHEDFPAVKGLVEEHFPNLEELELSRADVCRRTLEVEIEGTAEGAGLGADATG